MTQRVWKGVWTILGRMIWTMACLSVIVRWSWGMKKWTMQIIYQMAMSLQVTVMPQAIKRIYHTMKTIQDGDDSQGSGRGVSRGRGQSSGSYPPPWIWSDQFNEDSCLSSPPEFDEDHGPTEEALGCDLPTDYFRLLFDDSLVDLIVDQTNVYAAQMGYRIQFTRDDILGYIGMNIGMGIVGLPNVNDYWSREPILQTPWFPSVMSRRKFKAISRFLHFADNAKALPRDHPNYDRVWKIRPIIKSIQEKSQKMYVPGKCVNVDESMIGTKARLSFLQYLPKKPTKWGVKVWVCAEAESGYIYRFEVYTGKSSEVAEKGLAYNVVMNLMEPLLESGRTVYTDNFYSSPKLFLDLYSRGVYASGTVRVNKKEYPIEQLELQATSRGDSAFLYHGHLTAGKWIDKRHVHFLSTLLQDQHETLERRTANCGELEQVSKPQIISDYNQNMSGVDFADQLIVYYACGRKSMKWYKRLFWRMVDHAITNSYILVKQMEGVNHRVYTQKKYRIELTYKLTAPLLAVRMGPGRTPGEKSLSRLIGKHFPSVHPARKRCAVCAYKCKGPYSKREKDTKTKNYCVKCDKHLCRGRCYKRYHTLVKY